MSTRSQYIVVDETCLEETPIYIYKHWDGYPSAILPIILPFVEKFHKSRGNDSEYMRAQLLKALMGDCTDLDDFRGFGISDTIHDDIDYLYEIHSETGVVFVKTHRGEELGRFPLGTNAAKAVASLEGR